MRMLLLASAAFAAMTGLAAAAVQTGYIAVTDAASNASLGWISQTPNEFGEYVATTDPTDRLQVTYDGASAPFAIQTLGADPSTPWLGAIQGFFSTSADLGGGSGNYAYLGGTTMTAPGAAPDTQDNTFTAATGIALAAESSIWSQPGPASPLTPQWVNADSSLPVTSTLLSGGILILTGDAAAFTAQYGDATLSALSLVPTDPALPSPVPAPASLAVLGSGLLGMLVTRRRTDAAS